MVYGPPGFSVFRPWSNVGPRQMWMPRPTRPMMSFNYTNQCCGSYGSGMGNGAWWALGIGGFIGLLPSILGWCGVGGGRKAAAAQETAAQIAADRSSTLVNLEKLYKDKGYTIIDEGGKFYVTKDGETLAEGKTFAEIQTAMNEILKDSNPDIETGNPDIETGTLDANQIAGLAAEATKKGHSLEFKDGEWIIKDKDGNQLSFTDENGDPIKLTTEEQIRAALASIETEPAADDPVAAFNNNPAVKAKNASIAKTGDKFTLTINNADGSKTIYELDSIEAAYAKLGLSADGTPIKKGGGNRGRFTYPTLPPGFSWTEAPNGKYPKGTKAEDILTDLKKDIRLRNLTLDALLKANPIAIKDGVVSGEGKLEIPMTKMSMWRIPARNERELIIPRDNTYVYRPFDRYINTRDNGDGTETVTERLVGLDTAFVYTSQRIRQEQLRSTSDR